jgi:hypothetical protein
VMAVVKSIPGKRPAARSWVLFSMERMVLDLAPVWFLVRWLGRWVLGYGVLGSAVSMLFSGREMVGAGFGRDWWRWFAGPGCGLEGSGWRASCFGVLQRYGVWWTVGGIGWQLAEVCSHSRLPHRSWGWLEVEIPNIVALIFMVAAIRRLEAVLWEGISGHGSLFGSFRVLFFVCWLGQISPCSIEPGFRVLGFHVVLLL